MKIKLIFILFLFLLINSIWGLEQFQLNSDLKFAQVQFVKITEKFSGTWTFDVTLRHNDTDWDHYADLWIIVNPENGEILGSRVLAHPHVNEQPFTRSLSNVSIDESIRKVEIRAKCNVHGFEGKRVLIDFDNIESENYIIKNYD